MLNYSVHSTSDLWICNRPFRNLKKGTEESAAHSDSLGNSRKSEESPLLW